MRLVQTLRFLTGGWLMLLVLGGAALAQPNPDAPAYEMGVVLIQYDEAVYTAHLEDLLDDLLDKLPGGLGGFVGDQADVDIPLRPVGVVDDLLRTNGFPLAEVAARIDSLQTEAIDVGEEVDPHTVIDLLKDFFQDKPLAGVLHAQPNFLYYPHQTSAAYATDLTTNPDPSRIWAWHLKAIQLRDAWDEVWVRAADRPSGAGPITIGILDSGIDFGNSDLAGKKWSKTNCLDENGAMTTCNGGRDFAAVPHDADPTPVYDHGTWVAGVAAGEFNNGESSFGVAQDVELVGIRVYDPTAAAFTTLAVVQGVNFARHNKLDIINVSLGNYHVYQNCTEYSLTPTNSLIVEYQALQDYSAGLFVVAAGNDPWESGGVDTVHLPSDFASDLSLSGQRCWPGLNNVMQVGGTELDQVNNRERIWHKTTYGAHIDIAAGAKWIPTSGVTKSGTSFAAPQVAGVAALMLMVNPDLTPSELKAKLRDSADILEAFDGLDAAGNVAAREKNLADGRRLNAYRAVKLARGEETAQLDPLPEIVWNTDAFTASAPLVFREQGLYEAGGWEIAEREPVAVAGMGGDGDQVSSLIISAGYTVEVFRHPDYRGARLTYVGPQTVDLTGTSMNNQISSYKLYSTPTSAVDEVLVLRDRGLNETGGWEIAHNVPVAVPGMGGDGDQVSSLIIGAGYTVEVFRHPDYRGARLTYVGPQSVDLAGTSLDNQISSYKLYSTPDSAVAEVLVLRDRGLNETGGWEIGHSAPVEVPGMGWEDGDKVSSLTVAAGYTVEVFRHGTYTGARLTYVGPQEVDLAGTSLNNQISSYKFYVTPAVAVAEALVLRERGLNETGGWEIAHNAPVAVPGMGWEDGDKVSSFIIGAGYTVEVFRHGTYTGARLIYVGPQSVDLTGHTLDNQISSYKLYVAPPLVLREHRPAEVDGWEITQTAPVEVAEMGGTHNDRVSSLLIGAGSIVKVFLDPDFTGARLTYIGPQTVDLTGHTLDNQISSYKVSVAPPLVLREHGSAEVGGWEITQTAPVAVGWIGGAHNDRVSSLLIEAGYTVEVFRHWNYTGARLTYVGPQTADLAGQALDNQISSYKVSATPPSYQAAPLVLRDQGVNGAGGWEIVHTGPVEVGWIGGTHNDRVSSLRIGAGYTVEVFRDWAFGGTAQTYVGPQAVGLGAHGLNNQISSYKVYATP